MSNNKIDMREHIIEITIDIIEEVSDVSKITVRQIAKRADIGIGLINYYFSSKEQLLSIAIREIMSRTATEIIESIDEESNLAAKLKNMIKRLYSFSSEYENLIRFSLLQCIQNGDMGAELSLIPILKEIFKDETDEMHLRIIALQIIRPIQSVSLSPAAFRLYSGIDLYNEKERDRFVDVLVDNLI